MVGWRIVPVVAAGAAAVFCSFVAAGGGPGGPDTVVAATSASVCLRNVSPAGLATLFDTEPAGIVGADYPRALALEDGRVLWTFQDAAVRTGPGRIDVVHNIAAIQDGRCFTVLYGGTRSAPRPFLFGGRTDPLRRWFWPLDAAVGEDGRIYVYAAEMREDGASYLTRTVPTGTWVAVLDPSTLTVVDELRPPDSSADLYGWSVTSDHDWTYLYAHCYRQFGFDTYIFTKAFDRSCAADVTVARVPRGKLFDPPRYWDGRRWQADPRLAAPIIDRTGRRVNANQFEWTGSGFVSVNKEGDWWGDTIYVSHSATATGPFEVVHEIAAPTKCAVDCNSFFSSWIPAAAVDAGPGQYVYSLSHNRWDGVVSALYRPTFHAVRAPKLLPAGGTLRVGFEPGVGAAVVTLTSVEAAYPGFATVYPCAEGRPWTSNLNHHGEPVVANLVIARPDANGEVCIYSLAPVDLVVDVAGTFPAGDVVVPAPRPLRLADTRDGTGVRAGPVWAGTMLEVPVPSVDDGGAVALNVAAVDPWGPGFLTVFPCDRARPGTSNLNVGSEPAVSNLVVVEPSADDRVCVYSHGAADVVVDFVGSIGSGSFDSSTRLVDTRSAAGTRVPAGGVLGVTVPGGDPTALLNVVAVDPGGAGFLTVYPCGVPRPLASNLNVAVRPIVANLVVTALSADRRACVYSHMATDVVVDLVGGLDVALSEPTPVRVVDSRDGTGVPGQLGGS